MYSIISTCYILLILRTQSGASLTFVPVASTRKLVLVSDLLLCSLAAAVSIEDAEEVGSCEKEVFVIPRLNMKSPQIT